MREHIPQLTGIDTAIILLYIAANIFIGFVTFRRRRKDIDEFILVGRKLTLPAFVASLVSTWYGGIIAVGEYVYDNGIVTWIVFGVPYYIAAIIFARYLASRVNSDTRYYTIPDRMRAIYGKEAGYISAVVTAFMTSPAAYVMMLATLYGWFFGIDYAMAIVLVLVTSIAYLFTGGFRASIRTDILQFVTMFVGFAVIIPFLFSTYGGIGFIGERVPSSHLTLFGGYSIFYILVWYFIALATLVDPNVHQRVYAAKDIRTAKYGMYWSIVFWLVFDMMTNLTGLYAKAAFPLLSESKYAYPALADAVLPIGLRGLFYVGMLATVLSTVDSFMFTSATIIGREILWRIWGNGVVSKEKQFVRIGLLVTAVVSVGVISVSSKIYLIWYSMSSVLVPALLLPLVVSYIPRFKPGRWLIESAMVIAGLVSLSWYIIGVISNSQESPVYPLGIEPMFLGLLVSGVIVLPSYRRTNA
jgi:SSS family solute:Na+ symporter